MELSKESIKIKMIRDEAKRKLTKKEKIILMAAKAEADKEQKTL